MLVELHHKILMGDPLDKDVPGVVQEMRRANETLGEMKDALKRINWLIVAGFVTALLNVVLKKF